MDTKKIIIDYLIDKLRLIEFDNALKQDEMNFIPVETEYQTEVQRNNRGILKFFYIRNNIRIDRLSEEEKNELINGQYDDEFIDGLIKKILPYYYDEYIDSNIIYDMTLNPIIFNNDDIVIYLSTMEEYDEKGNFVNLEHEKAKQVALIDYCANMEDQISEWYKVLPVKVVFVEV